MVMDRGYCNFKRLIEDNLKSETFWNLNKSLYIMNKFFTTIKKMHEEIKVFHIDIKP